MPSPLNTPTNEILPNHLQTGMSALEWSNSDNCETKLTTTCKPIKDMEPQTDPSHQLTSSAKLDISESQTSGARRTGRLGLNLDLNQHLNESNTRKKPFICFGKDSNEDLMPEVIDESIPLEKQSWFHGYISRLDAENLLRDCKAGSYLVRRCHTSKPHYSLSLKCVRGFMHIKIVQHSDGSFTFGTSNLTFTSIPQIVSHYGSNRLPIRGAEHMSLLNPIIVQLL